MGKGGAGESGPTMAARKSTMGGHVTCDVPTTTSGRVRQSLQRVLLLLPPRLPLLLPALSPTQRTRPRTSPRSPPAAPRSHLHHTRRRLQSSPALDIGPTPRCRIQFCPPRCDETHRARARLVFVFPLSLSSHLSCFLAVVQRLFHRAHEYGNLSNRAGPIATDLVMACSEFNMPPSSFRKLTSRARKRARSTCPSPLHYISNSQPYPEELKAVHAPTLIPAPSRSPSPELLSSDEEDAHKSVPLTLRMLPTYFPDLPPKHTYLRTPVRVLL